MKYSPRERSRLLPVEITSMVDVVFLLIIFFMTAAKVAREERIDLELPREAGRAVIESAESGLIVNLRADGIIVLSGTEVTLEQLERSVRSEVARRYGGDASMVRLTIRADRGASAQALNDVVERVRAVGIGGASVATEVPRGLTGSGGAP